MNILIFLRIAFYIRVSTEDQAKEWYGIEFQLDSMNHLLEFKSKDTPFWKHDKKHLYIDEGCTGSNLNRNGFHKMMKDAKKWEFDIIVVWKIDRLSRNLSHLLTVFEELREQKIGFYSIKESLDFSWPVGKLIFQIFWALAEFDREMIKSRTSEWKKASARRGNYIWNGIPYGFDAIRQTDQKWTKLKIVPSEAKIVRQIFSWFVFDHWHYAKIAKKLDELKIAKWVAAKACNKGTKWHQTTIKNMLRNTAYVWTRVENIKDDDGEFERIEVTVPTLIEQNIFEFAQLRIKDIDDEKEGKKSWGWDNTYLLSRKIYDIETGKCLVWYSRYRGKTYGYRRKAFKDPKTGMNYRNVDITWEAVDHYVWDHIQLALNRPEKLFLMFQKQVSEWNDLSQLKSSLQDTIQLIEQNNAAIDAIEMDYYKGRISETRRDWLVNKLRWSNTKLEKQEQELDEKIQNLVATLYSKELIKKVAENYRKNLKWLSLEQKQVIVNALIDKVLVKVHENGEKRIKVIFGFDPDWIDWNEQKDELKNGTIEGKPLDAVSESLVNGDRNTNGYFFLYLEAKLNTYREGRVWKSEFVTIPNKTQSWFHPRISD